MKTIAATLIALAASASAWAAPHDTRPANGECEWRNPGGSKYMLPLPVAVDRLDMIPAETRTKLKARLEANKAQTADDHILITAAGVTGMVGEYALFDMNGGQGSVCWGEVTTKTWKPEHAERALVFCEDGHCIAYFSVCRNISRAILLKRNEKAPAPTQHGGMPLMPAKLSWERERLDIVLGFIPVDFIPAGHDGGEHSEFSWGWQPLPRDGGGVVPLPPRGQQDGSFVQPVPEPRVYALMGLGLVLVAWMARRRKKQSETKSK